MLVCWCVGVLVCWCVGVLWHRLWLFVCRPCCVGCGASKVPSVSVRQSVGQAVSQSGRQAGSQAGNEAGRQAVSQAVCVLLCQSRLLQYQYQSVVCVISRDRAVCRLRGSWVEHPGPRCCGVVGHAWARGIVGSWAGSMYVASTVYLSFQPPAVKICTRQLAQKLAKVGSASAGVPASALLFEKVVSPSIDFFLQFSFLR